MEAQLEAQLSILRPATTWPPKGILALFTILSEGRSGHPLLGGRGQSTFSPQHPGQSWGQAACCAGAATQISSRTGKVTYVRDTSMVTYSRAWRGVWQAGEPCWVLSGRSSCTGKRLFRDSPRSLGCQVTVSQVASPSLDHRDIVCPKRPINSFRQFLSCEKDQMSWCF